MSITLICPHLSCGRAVVAPDSARGKAVRCVHCGNEFQVPFHVASSKDGADAPKSKTATTPSKGGS